VIHQESKREDWKSLLAFSQWVKSMDRAGWLHGHHKE
jgi:hypothetical protein